MKYNEKNYNRKLKQELYHIPPLTRVEKTNRKSMMFQRTGRVRRPTKKSMAWVQDLLAN
ncbi:MAG: hypothetical protein ACMXYL_03885 [Candidatus Woesearchaeota archaeon]